ncbi:DUF1642 domain-containing protein [Streptococcus intermedius]|uniref:DUF1642 domain-containing protein n=1 Tax=Streptococcus intermedius TaxID=1338 RepID=UPI000E3E006E|nr:DUF1642 domain-containing protein [Streptococcus intermedius]
MTEFKIGDKVWVKGVINQIDKGNVWDLYISTRENGVWIDSRLDKCIPRNDTDGKPLYLRNVLARLRELPEHDRKVWMDEIMHEFASDYGSVKYTLGYEQGKFDEAIEAEKPNTVVIPQFVAKWIDYCKFTHVDLQHALVVGDVYFYNYANQKDFSKLKEFLETENNQELFARAWLDGYEVEKEKRYKAVLPNLYEEENVLHFSQEDEVWYFNNDFNDNVSVDKDSRYHTRKELEDAGFGWVFDCEGLEVQEVE